ncbi:MAG: GTPase [Candidatus Aenigmarchaeota archaeon]|nr:GTPase [Candidatus Aenigmarchaeota archaeon]
MTVMKQKRVIIMGAAGRDFHNFNTYFRNNRYYKVVAFTAAQIPDIEGRIYPPKISGRLYPKGIPIYPESDLAALIRKHKVDKVVFSYSDISHEEVMHRASIALANGADFILLGMGSTALKSSKPVIAVCAVRTGAGKSPTSRYVVNYLLEKKVRVVAVRHPMPYGNLAEEEVQRFEKYEDFQKHKCTIEEREEYEPYIRRGVVVFAGVDYEKILRIAEKEADVILWDGGNNDLPFFKPDLHITIADPHRAGHEISYHPGEANLRAADVILISKTGTAPKKNIRLVIENSEKANPKARIIKTDMKLTADKAEAIRGKKVLVVEDGPTLTHGGMAFGAGAIVAERHGAKIIDASRHAAGSIKKVYQKYPHLKKILPAMGYSRKQIGELEKTINRAKCDFVVEATPINLAKLIRINKPVISVEYELDAPKEFDRILDAFARKVKR